MDASNAEKSPALLKLAPREREWCARVPEVGGGPFGDDATEPAGVAAPTPSGSRVSRVVAAGRRARFF